MSELDFSEKDSIQPLVGVGSCLVGQPVRYNGDHKRHNPHIEKLSQHVQLQSICPEVGIGLGVPRPPIRIVDQNGQQRLMDSDSQRIDYTDRIHAYADTVKTRHPLLSGYILVKGSPSCGMERVKRYNKDAKVIAADTMGIYAQQLLKGDPLLPVEEDGRLYDHGLRESFVSRVYLYHDWKIFLQNPLTAKGLIEFYSRYKYLVMAHSVSHYRELGPMLADLKNRELDPIAAHLITNLMAALKKVATPAGHTNVLQHLQGYLKQSLSPAQKKELGQVIEDYRRGIVPLVTPLTLLQHHFNRSPNSYIDKQAFMAPYPGELALRSFISSQ